MISPSISLRGAHLCTIRLTPTATKKADKKPIEEPEAVVPPLNALQPSELTTEKLLRQAVGASPAPVPAPAAPLPTPAAAVTPAPAHTPPARKGKKKQEANVLALIGESFAVPEKNVTLSFCQIVTCGLLKVNRYNKPPIN